MSLVYKCFSSRPIIYRLYYTHGFTSKGKRDTSWYFRQRRFSTNGSRTSESSSRTIRFVSSAAIIIVGGSILGRFLYGNLLLDPNDRNRGPKLDTSKATVVLNGTARSQQNNHQLTIKNVNSSEFSTFCQRQREILRDKRMKGEQAAKEVLEKELRQAILSEASSARIRMFADWYFNYFTTWKLISVSLSSAARHATTFRTEQTLSEAVSSDLQSYVCRKYEALVLRPASINPKIHQAFVNSINFAHEEYLRAIAETEDSVAEFLRNSAYSTPPGSNNITVDVDWKAQLQKVEHVPLAYEKAPEATIALVGMGATVGKIAGGAATKTMLGKMAAPFVTKAVGATLSKGVAVGAASGGLLAGPLGAIFGSATGAAVGVGVDMTINAGISLMQRDSFENDVSEAVDGTILELTERLWPEVERVQTVWFDHAENLMLESTRK